MVDVTPIDLEAGVIGHSERPAPSSVEISLVGFVLTSVDGVLEITGLRDVSDGVVFIEFDPTGCDPLAWSPATVGPRLMQVAEIQSALAGVPSSDLSLSSDSSAGELPAHTVQSSAAADTTPSH